MDNTTFATASITRDAAQALIAAAGKRVGGIGISGGNAVQDQQATEIALKALGFEVG